MTGDRVFIRADHEVLSIEQIAKHEEFHVMVAKNPALLSRTASDIMARFSGRELSDMVEFYAAAYAGLSYAEALEEVPADAYAEMNAFEGTALDRVVGNATRYTGVTRETAAATDRTTGPPVEKFSIEYTEDNTPFVVVEEDILAGVPKGKWVPTVKNANRTRHPKGVQIANSAIKINSKSIDEIFNSVYSTRLKTTYPLIFKDKLRAAAQSGEVLAAARNWINEDLKHPRKDKIISFARGDVLLRVGDNDYAAEVVVGYTSGNNMLLYDVVAMQPTASIDKKRYSSGTTALTTESNNASSAAPTPTVSTHSIPTKSENVNGEKEKLSREVAEQEALSNNKTALKYFGQTHRWAETGYLLLDGKRLDFSGKHDGAPGVTGR